ncbi:hypothetical protein NJD71_12205 [Psychrobacter sp. PP-21]|uniref:hypothetical protein n=1 Tax=Psychrobacter sp. PP-21 TaxID=2957503 RepID=UPI0029AFF0C9|nr:hypothetical protein [Psychrobacter sp. PP-21]MDX2374880.1 hypothetical protein [Psychrobacter sp. PP-21]
MYEVYEDESIPLQIRRLMIFDEICKLAKKEPDEIIHLSRFTQLSLGVMYLKDFKKFIAFGGVFEYAQTPEEVIEQRIRVFPNDEPVKCALTVNLKQFTRPASTPIQLVWYWNKYVKNRMHAYVDYREEVFFRINDEIDSDYPPHKFHDRLVATARLPLWDDRDELIADVYRDNQGEPKPERYNERRLL